MTISRLLALAGLAGAACFGCTALGPVPGVTGASVVPQARPGAEVQAGAVPGYMLSQATQPDGDGTPIGQAAGLFEPGELIGLPGLAAGGRFVGNDDADTYFEPMVRYRTYVGGERRLALGVLGFGTHTSGSERGASYSMTHAGLELGVDVRATPLSRWAELHLLGGAGLAGLDAGGRYCMDATTGWGRDCDEGVRGSTEAEASGVVPSFFSGAAVDLGRHLELPFHGARLAGWMGGGWMPVVQHAEQQDARGWAAGGLTLTVGLGATRDSGQAAE